MTLTVHNIRKFSSDLNKDSITVNKWTLSMEKKLLVRSQIIKVMKLSAQRICVPSTCLNNTSFSKAQHKKHLGFLLDNRLSFQQYLKATVAKVDHYTQTQASTYSTEKNFDH